MKSVLTLSQLTFGIVTALASTGAYAQVVTSPAPPPTVIYVPVPAPVQPAPRVVQVTPASPGTPVTSHTPAPPGYSTSSTTYPSYYSYGPYSGRVSPAGTTPQAPLTPVMYQGVDIAPLVDYIGKAEIVELTAPVSVYNWSKNGRVAGLESSNYAQRASRSFWQAYGHQDGRKNMYGTGLYAAVDPVATFSYGSNGYGGDDVWHLIEMVLPKGLRIIDVSARMSSMIAQEAMDLMNRFGCHGLLNADNAFSAGGLGLSASCRDLAKFIYKDHFKIQAFAYQYQKMDFPDCRTNSQNNRAFVITSSDWMNSNSVKYYSPSTQDKLEDRRRIQTLMLEATRAYSPQQQKVKPTLSEGSKKMIADYLDKNQGFELKGSTSKCDDETCVITAQFCDAKGTCEKLELEPVVKDRSSLITSDDARYTAPQKLMWKDLESKKKFQNIGAWMKENHYMCGGKPAFQNMAQ